MSLDLAIVTGSLSQAAGGLFESVRIPANRLSGQGVNVSVYGLVDAQLADARAAWQVNALKAFPTRGPHRLGYSPALQKELIAARHDLVHLHGIWSYLSANVERWGRRHARPTVVSPRGMLDPWALRRSSLKKQVVRRLYEDRNLRAAAALHALNSSEAQSIRALGLGNPIAVIPNGVDLPALDAAPPRPDWRAGDDRKVMLFLSRLHPKKGLTELLDAWRRMVADHPAVAQSWRLAIAGWDDGGHLPALRDFVADNDLAGHVDFIGSLYGAEKAAAFHHVSAFILPSYSEGMPMAVLEAWGHGLPAFITAQCNLPQGISSGAAFEITLDPAEIADVLADRLGNDAALRAAGRAGRLLVEQSFTWDRIVGDMRDFYDWVLGVGQPPPFVML